MEIEIRPFMEQQGYRYLEVETEGAAVFYKYYKEGFHVVLTVDFTGGDITGEQHSIMENRLLDFFYHPQGRLADFPEGFPVYHVELLTLLLGGGEAAVRRMCAEKRNVWAYCMPEGRLIIYENQPGEFFGLRNAIEEFNAGNNGNSCREKPLEERTKGIKNLPLATIALTAANVLVYVILEIMGDTENGFFIASHGGMYPEFLTYNHQWWRLFTAMFIHFGLEHLLNNMVIFCCVGSRLERAVGHVRLLMFYLFSGIGGGLLSYLMMEWSGDYAVAAGASGAVFGIIGALLWAVIRHRGRFQGMTTRGLLVMLALSLYYGFSTIGVDNWSHIGGMVTGFAAAAIFYHGKVQKY